MHIMRYTRPRAHLCVCAYVYALAMRWRFVESRTLAHPETSGFVQKHTRTHETHANESIAAGAVARLGVFLTPSPGMWSIQSMDRLAND